LAAELASTTFIIFAHAGLITCPFIAIMPDKSKVMTMYHFCLECYP